MSKVCLTCGKAPAVGYNVSHSHRHTKRRFEPNLKQVRAVKPSGEVCTMTVCTRCLRSGTVVKPAVRETMRRGKEQHFNRLFLAAASEPKGLWELPDARHAAGYFLDPKAYAEKVVSFFDAYLT